MKKAKDNLVILLFIGTIFSCNRIFEEHRPFIDANYWLRNDTLQFDIDIDNPDKLYDVIIAIRHAELYPFESIIVNIQCITPSGKETNITKDLYLIGEDGKFNGEPMGDIWDKEIIFKDKEKFHEKGKHKFLLTHQMATDTLPMVMEIGLIIERSSD